MTTTGAEQSAAQLGRVAVSHDAVATAAATSGRTMAGYEAQMAAIQKRQEAYTAAIVANTAALTNSNGAMVAANDNAARSFAGASIEAASLANHVKLVGEAAYAFSPAFREVVNGLAAPVLRGASVALVAVAGGIVTATNLAGTGLVRLGAAAASVAPSFGPVAAGITSAGVAMQAFSPSLAGVATSILSKLAPAISFVLGPVLLLYHAVSLMMEAWRLGGEELDRYRKIAEDAAKVDLSTTYFQRLSKGAEAAKLPVEALTAALTTLQKQSADQLGGSALGNRLAASVKVGNFADNTGVQEYAQANTTQQRYEAIVSLIHQAMQAGQRLAALDIAGTAFGPEAADNLRKDSEYFDKLNAAAAKISDAQLVSPEDIGRAIDLQTRYDAAVKILETRWHPIQELLTQAGIEFHANWVATVETIANGVDWATKLVMKLGDVPSWFQKKLNEGSQWIIDNTTTPESRKAAETSYGISSDPAAMAKGTDSYAVAVNKLRGSLQDQAEQQRKVSESNTIAQKTLGDSSHQIDNLKKKTEEAADAYDRALEGVTKHTARMQADTLAVGLGAGALEEFRARAQLTTAAQLAGRESTAALTAEIEKQAKAAGAAGEALAKMRINNQIQFDRSTIGLSADDVQIATQLRSIYPDVTTALNSSEAAAMRLNNEMRLSKDITSGFGNDLVSGLMRGEDAMKSLTSAASNLVQKLAAANLNRFMSGGSLFGNQNLMSGNGALGVASAGVAGYQSGNAATGALSGAMAGATFGPAGAVVGGVAGLIGGILGADAQAKAKLEAAQTEWKAAGPAFELFLSQMTGGVQGGLSQTFQQLLAQVNDFATKAAKAQDLASVGRVYDAFNANVYRTTDAFRQSFGGMLDAINAGLGPNSPFAAASDNVKQVGTTLKGFIDDVRVAYANDRIAAAAGSTPLMAGGGEDRIAAATAAAQKYLLTLLGQPPVLSEVATAIQKMQGTAVQLKSVLTDLGMSAEDAGRAIDNGVTKAMKDLADNFSAGLTARLNTASGASYLNDATALLKQHTQDVADAASLAISQAEVAAVFHAEAQKIVDDAGLVGDSFSQFIDLFPDFNGVVSQSSTALQAATEKVQAFVKSLNDYLNGLKVGANSTLSPQGQLAAAQSAFSAQFALAQAGNADALGTITQYASTLLDQAKSFYASSAGYSNIYDQVTNALKTLPASLGATDSSDKIVAAINTTATTSDALQAQQNALAAQQATYLQTQVSLLGAINSLADRFVNAINGLGGITAGIGNTHTQQFGDMIGQLVTIARTSGSGSSGSIWSWLGFQNGGVIPGYADGGVVGNGTFGIDSVRARYAGGGDIMLAGGEYVMPATQTTMFRSQLDAMRSGGWANDNRAPAASSFDWQGLARANKQISDISDERLLKKLDELIDAVNATPGKNTDATRRLVANLKQRAAG
ncbi:hypothetical protein [Rhodopseudomonas sp. RCAM05734]|uniref:hypothetical protein n=1 Tax=Rhodopseudomonas sp. RCAM05734 TaxID=3457549 RepID=UPI0040439A7A